MTKWSILLAGLTISIASNGASAADAAFVGCWDETFAYDIANILQVDDGFEITMNGSTLHGDPIRTHDGIEFQLDSPTDDRFLWHSELGLYVKLPPGSCAIDTAGQTVHCQATIPAATSFRTAYVTWRQSDIDMNRTTGAPIVGMATSGELTQVSFDLSEQGAKISLTSSDGQSHTVTKSVRIDPYENTNRLICNLVRDGTNNYLTRGFPDRLRAYLQRP